MASSLMIDFTMFRGTFGRFRTPKDQQDNTIWGMGIRFKNKILLHCFMEVKCLQGCALFANLLYVKR